MCASAGSKPAAGAKHQIDGERGSTAKPEQRQQFSPNPWERRGWEREARKELALAFYARGVLSLGKTVELAETSRM